MKIVQRQINELLELDAAVLNAQQARHAAMLKIAAAHGIVKGVEVSTNHSGAHDGRTMVVEVITVGAEHVDASGKRLLRIHASGRVRPKSTRALSRTYGSHTLTITP